MSYFHFNSVDWLVKWWISRDWPVKKVATFVMLHLIFPFQFPGLVGEMVNFLWLASEKSCYLCEKMSHIWKPVNKCNICNIAYFHFNSLDWSVKWWISRDWPVKMCEIVVTFVKKKCYICYICYMSNFHFNSLDWPVKWWSSMDWPVNIFVTFVKYVKWYI